MERGGKMAKLSREVLIKRFPWAAEVVPEVDEGEGYFYDLDPWDFSQEQFKLLEQMFEEIDNWFKQRDLPVDVVVYRVANVLDSIHVELFSNVSEVHTIVKKYKQFSRDLIE